VTEVTVLDVGRDAMIVVLKLSLPLLMATLVIGLIIALFQALTSIQEMTLTFVPKIVVVFVGMIVFLPFMMRVIVEFGERLFDRIVGLGLG